MIVAPKTAPVLGGLNSYYLNVPRLIEHCQGAIGSGCVLLTSASIRAAVYFDSDEVLAGVITAGDRIVSGQSGLDRLLSAARRQNFTVDVYRLEPQEVFFWANMYRAEVVYANLNTAFTDPAALIAKMAKEKLTGYIRADAGDGDSGGILFLSNGQVVGGTVFGPEHPPAEPEKLQTLFVNTTKRAEGVFQVGRIPPVVAPQGPSSDESRAAIAPDADVLAMIETLLKAVEAAVVANKRIRTGFETLLRRKFLQKAEQYGFLDPFAAEFTYAAQTVRFTGEARPRKLVAGVVESVTELAGEIGMTTQLDRVLAPWFDAYESQLAQLGIRR